MEDGEAKTQATLRLQKFVGHQVLLLSISKERQPYIEFLFLGEG